MHDKNAHYGGRGVHAAPEPAYGVPAASEPEPAGLPLRTPSVPWGRTEPEMSVGAPVTPAEACAMARMLRRHGYTVEEPSMKVGAPIAGRDAESLARILAEHGYRISPPRTRSKRRRHKGGVLVGACRALGLK